MPRGSHSVVTADAGRSRRGGADAIEGIAMNQHISGEEHKLLAVYGKLKDLVVNYRFRPGDHLQITELAEMLGVSVTPIREVLTRLYGESLVISHPNRGFFAKSLAVEEMRALYELALVILKYAIKKNLAKLSLEGFDVPIGIRRQRENGHSISMTSDLCLSYAFFIEHLFERIAALSENDAMVAIIKNFNDRTHYIRMVDLEAPQNIESILAGVARLITQLDERDEGGAIEILEDLFNAKLSRLTELVEKGLGRAHMSSISKLSIAAH
jgi:DNA-binding GntR family transcriptional regulator